jgi:hypothetical protein
MSDRPQYTKEAEALLRGLAERIHHDCPPPILEARAFLDAMKGEREKCPRCDSPSPKLHPAMQFEGEVSPCSHPFHEAPPEPKADERTVEERILSLVETVQAAIEYGVTHGAINWRGALEEVDIKLRRILAAHRAEVEHWRAAMNFNADRADELQRRIDAALEVEGGRECASKMARILEGRDNQEAGK